MPLVTKTNLFCQIQRHLNRGDQRLRVAEVRALMEVDPIQGQVIFFAELAASKISSRVMPNLLSC